jgi:hypothetical protein
VNRKENAKLNDNELKVKVAEAAEIILNETGYVAPVEVLMKVGVLTKGDYEAWRNGKVPYLEKVCRINLIKLSLIMSELRSFGDAKKLKLSFTGYTKWGKGPKTKLRFTRTGDTKIETYYSTHFVGLVRE